MNDNPFWMVYGAGQGAPTARHGSQDIAETEARRLARNNPGIEFYVLQTVARAVKIDVQVTRFERRDIDADIPF